MNKIHPDFVIIGAMKSASTSLALLLSRHPKIYMSPEKEPGFFSRDERYATGIDHYLTLYSEAGKHQMTGEASTCYTRKIAYPLAAKRLHDHAPDCKLVYLLRDPVKRAYSHYAFTMAQRLSTEGAEVVISYAQALEDIDEIIDASDYFGQIKHYLQYFPRAQLHCILLEDLVANEKQELNKLCDFLGVDFLDDENWVMNNSNEKGDVIALRRSRRFTQKVLSIVPVPIKNIFSAEQRENIKLKIQDFFTKRFRDSAKKSVDTLILPAAAEEQKFVYGRLKESILELEDFLGREVAGWKKYESQFDQ